MMKVCQFREKQFKVWLCKLKYLTFTYYALTGVKPAKKKSGTFLIYANFKPRKRGKNLPPRSYLSSLTTLVHTAAWLTHNRDHF